MDTNLFAQGFEAGTAWAQTAKHVAAGDLTAAREYAVDMREAIEAAMDWENQHDPIPPERPGVYVSAEVADCFKCECGAAVQLSDLLTEQQPRTPGPGVADVAEMF